MVVQVSETQQDDVLILQLDGRLDAASSPLLERKLGIFLDAGQSKFVLNFEHVEYLSSAGLRLLLVVSKKLKSQQGKLVLAAVQSDVVEVIRMAGFDHVLDLCATEAEALKQLQG